MRPLPDSDDATTPISSPDDFRHRARVVADQLEGTCKDLSDFATEAEQNNIDFCNELDRLTIKCACCDWWTAVEDLNDEGECGDC